MGVGVWLGQLHLREVEAVLAHVRAHLPPPRHQHRDTPTTHPAHLLYGDGALADRVEGLRVVVILKVGRIVVGLGAAVILKIFVGQ